MRVCRLRGPRYTPLIGKEQKYNVDCRDSSVWTTINHAQNSPSSQNQHECKLFHLLPMSYCLFVYVEVAELLKSCPSETVGNVIFTSHAGDLFREPRMCLHVHRDNGTCKSSSNSKSWVIGALTKVAKVTLGYISIAVLAEANNRFLRIASFVTDIHPATHADLNSGAGTELKSRLDLTFADRDRVGY